MQEFSEWQPEQIEYDFESGIQQTLDQVKKLLRTQDYVVISICGSSHNVGKTRLASRIMQRLSSEGISLSWQSDIASMTEKPIFTHQPDTRGHVLVFGSEQPAIAHPLMNRQAQDERLARRSKRVGLPLPRIDLHVYI